MANELGLYVTAAAAPPAWPWRVLAALAMLAALALLAWTLARWGWTWLGPKPVTVTAPLPETDLARRASEAHLFGRAGGEPATAGPAGANLGDVRLLGVFAEREGRGYALLRSGTRAPVLVEAGQEISPGVRVDGVRPDGISIVQGGVRHELALRAQTVTDRRVAAAAPDKQAACAPPAGFKGPVVRLNAELLGGMIDAPGAWKALVTPTSGALVVRDQSGFAGMLSLKNGDRIERANGIALALPDDIAETILQPLTRSQPVWLAGTRDGKPQQWLYLNAGSCPG